MASKKTSSKPTLVDRARKEYQKKFDQRNDPDQRLRAAEGRKPAVKKSTRQWGEPEEMSEAQKASIRALRAGTRKRTGK